MCVADLYVYIYISLSDSRHVYEDEDLKIRRFEDSNIDFAKESIE